MISKEIFAKTIQRIRNAYNKQEFLNTSDALNDWYVAFKDCSEWSFSKAVDECIKEEEWLPTIAKIYSRYKTYEDERQKHIGEFRVYWTNFCSDYPDGDTYVNDKECMVQFKKLTVDKFDGDYAKGYDLAHKYRAEMKAFVMHNGDLPGFKDYLMSLE